ncbi:MAG: hypothetical protein AB7P20_05560 [Rhizobiaceae bacterium]
MHRTDQQVDCAGDTMNRFHHFHGRIVLENGATRACIVWDVSAMCAQISAEIVDDIPTEFILHLNGEAVRRRCRKLWRMDNKIKVQFVGLPASDHDEACLVEI